MFNQIVEELLVIVSDVLGPDEEEQQMKNEESAVMKGGNDCENLNIDPSYSLQYTPPHA